MKRSVLSLLMVLVMIFNLGVTALAYTETGAPDVDVDTDGSGDFNIDFDALSKTEGSETNPVVVTSASQMAILVIPANGEVWYDVTTDLNGKYLTVNGNANTVVSLNGVEYLPNTSGVIQVKLDGETANKLQVSNTGSSNANWSTTVGNPTGSENSPLVVSTASALKSLSVAGHDTMYVELSSALAGKELTIAVAEGLTVTCNGTVMTPNERGYVTILGSDTTTVTLSNSTDSWITVAASIQDPLGSQTNPIDLVWTWNADNTEGTATAVIPPKTTYYYNIYVSGMELYVNGNYKTTTTGTNKKPQVVSVSNNGPATTSYALKLTYPTGTEQNPRALIMGQNYGYIEEGVNENFYFTWTAEETGYLTITMDCDSWTYTITNVTTNKELATGWHTEAGTEAVVLPVTAGDQLLFTVSTYDPWAWFPPTGELYLNASFSTELVCLHTNETTVAGKAATCTETGLTEGKVCADCGETIVAQTEIPALGHSEETVAGKAATCTETGLTEGKKCSVCGETTVAQTEIPALGHSYENGTCGTCGAADPDAIVKFDIDVARMVLGNALEFQFGVAKSRFTTTEGYYAVIEKAWADGSTTTKTIPAEEWGTVGTYWAIVYDGMAAKEMGDIFNVTIYNAKGQAISNAKTDSVRDYVMRNVDKSTDVLKTLMVNMLNYGAAAQLQFNYATDDLANNQLTDTQKSWASTSAKELNSYLVRGTNYMGTRLVLESRIQLQVAFKGMTRDMYAIYTYTDNNGKAQSVRVEGADFVDVGVLGVEMSVLVYADARNVVEITVYTADGTVYGTATDSIEGYVQRNAKGETDVSMELMKFADSAKAYLYGN